MLTWYCFMVRVIHQKAKGLDSNSTLPCVGCVWYHPNRWTGSTKQFQFYKHYFRVSRLVALLSVQTARQTATHRSNQPGLSSNAVVFSTKTFSVSAFNAFSSAPPGENKAKRGGEERPTNQKTIEGWILVQVAQEIAFFSEYLRVVRPAILVKSVPPKWPGPVMRQLRTTMVHQPTWTLGTFRLINICIPSGT